MDTAEILELAQGEETPVQSVRRGGFAYRYAYARAAESIDLDETGQDYLAVRDDEHRIAFALCDGVGQSFFGDLSAREVGRALIEWLWTAADLEQDAQRLAGGLSVQLRELIDPISKLVKDQRLPPALSPRVERALEEKRAYGSDTMFVCGRLDIPSGANPHGRVLLAWLGDVRRRLWSPGGEITASLGDSLNTSERWSSARGPVGGDPHLWLAPLVKDGIEVVTRLLVYSDGLSLLDHYPTPPDNTALRQLMLDLRRSRTSDDVSLFELWLGEPPGWLEPIGLPAPQNLETTRDTMTWLSWQEVRGATTYQIESIDAEGVRWRRMTGAPRVILPAGLHKLRVRALAGNQAGEWSKELRVVATRAAPDRGVPPAPGKHLMGREGVELPANTMAAGSAATANPSSSAGLHSPPTAPFSVTGLPRRQLSISPLWLAVIFIALLLCAAAILGGLLPEITLR